MRLKILSLDHRTSKSPYEELEVLEGHWLILSQHWRRKNPVYNSAFWGTCQGPTSIWKQTIMGAEKHKQSQVRKMGKVLP